MGTPATQLPNFKLTKSSCRRESGLIPPCSSGPRWLMGRGTLGAGQLTALILGQNSGGHSQVLLGLLASLNQPQHPLCRLCRTLQGEEVAAAPLPPPRVSASRPGHSNKNTIPESHNPWEPRRTVEEAAPSLPPQLPWAA